MIEFSFEAAPVSETPTEPEVIEKDSKSSGGSMSFICLLGLMIFSRRINSIKN
jgi:hypothetical protein